MKAIVQNKYGPPSTLKVEEVKKPSINSNQVLIKVIATSLNAPDWRLLRGKPFITRFFSGLIKPKNRVKGTDFAGIIEEVGEDISSYKPGDYVYGDLSDYGFGTFAEYIASSVKTIQHMPKNISFLESAALPLTASTALQAIVGKAEVKNNDSVLIVGASGGVGSYALQIAKVYASSVTAVVSSSNVEQAKALGADKVIDYKKQELNMVEDRFDVIIAINGNYQLEVYKKLLKKNGRFVLVGSGSTFQLVLLVILGSVISALNGKKFSSLIAKQSAENLKIIKTMVEEKKLKPIIYKQISFDEIPEGLAELELGSVPGKIVALINNDSGISD